MQAYLFQKSFGLRRLYFCAIKFKNLCKLLFINLITNYQQCDVINSTKMISEPSSNIYKKTNILSKRFSLNIINCRIL